MQNIVGEVVALSMIVLPIGWMVKVGVERLGGNELSAVTAAVWVTSMVVWAIARFAVRSGTA